MIGTLCIFNYPREFTSLPEYTARSGALVTILRPLIDGVEYDNEGDALYEVTDGMGWVGYAYASELTTP